MVGACTSIRRFVTFYTSALDILLSPIHTADADATQLSSWVASAVCIEFATSWRQSRRVSASLNNLPTTKSSCVVSAVWTYMYQSSVVTQFPIFCDCASHIGCRIVNWVTTADGLYIYTPPTQLNSTQLDSWVASASAVCTGYYLPRPTYKKCKPKQINNNKSKSSE